MKFTFVRASVKSVGAETPEDFADMGAVFVGVVGVDEDVVEVNYHADIDEIGEYVVHEPLESSGGVRETERHDAPFEGAISCAEGGFPFVSGCDADQMIRVPEINLGIDTGLPRRIEEIGYQRKRIPILPSDFVESSIIDAESERTVFFLDEKYRSSMRGTGGAYAASGEVFVKKLAKGS